VKASRSGVGGHQGCSLTTSWLQRSGERHPVFVGSSGWRRKAQGPGGTAEASLRRRPITLTRREAVSVGSTGVPVTKSGIHFFDS